LDVNRKIDPAQSRTYALNVEGIFFQRRVADIFRWAGWKVAAEEYPVAFPPGDWPTIGKEGRLDIRVERRFPERRIVLAVECKKADSSYKDWVFFPKGHDESIKCAQIIRKEKDGAATSATGRDRWEITTAIVELDKGQTCQDARELKAEHGKTNSWKSATERIEKACYQAAQSTQALVSEIGRRQGLLLNHQMEPEVTTLVMPVVVTTANLLLCHFDAKDVSLQTGEVGWNQVSYEAVDSIVLEYPLPVHLQMKPLEPLKVPPEDISMAKKHVLIITGSGLEVFLQSETLDVSSDDRA
jgi:hypothetical protein